MSADPAAPPHRHSVARYFVENRHVSWVLLVGVIAWGIWAYAAMPKRKDPDIPVRQVAVVAPWPGQSAERVEQLVTRKIEERVAQNIRVSEITSTTRVGLSVVYAEVDENARIDTGKEFDDIKVKLDALTDLPEGAGPIQYIKEFGETSALMLTVASPPASGPQLQLLASQIVAAAAPRSFLPRRRPVQFRLTRSMVPARGGRTARRCPGASGRRNRSATHPGRELRHHPPVAARRRRCVSPGRAARVGGAAPACGHPSRCVGPDRHQRRAARWSMP